MRYILIAFILLTSVNADKVNKKTLACPTMDALKKAPLESLENSLELSMYAIANGCEILSKNEHVEVTGADPRNSKDLFQQIVYNKTGVIFYVKSSAINIEQSGKKNSLKF